MIDKPTWSYMTGGLTSVIFEHMTSGNFEAVGVQLKNALESTT